MNIYCQPRSLFPREIFLPSFMVYEAGVDFCRKKLWDLQLPDLWKNDQQVKFPIADVFSFNLSKVKFQTPYPFGEDLFSGPGSWVKASNVARPFQPRQVDVSFKRYPPWAYPPRICEKQWCGVVHMFPFCLLASWLCFCWWTKSCTVGNERTCLKLWLGKDFVHSKWCRILSINSISSPSWRKKSTTYTHGTIPTGARWAYYVVLSKLPKRYKKPRRSVMWRSDSFDVYGRHLSQGIYPPWNQHFRPWKSMVGIRSFPFGMAYFQGLC